MAWDSYERHGMSGTPIYRSWGNMKSRSTPGSAMQLYYPGYVGVSRDPRWDRFTAFYEDMGESWFPGAALSRYEDEGDYEPGNCRWVTKAENARDKSKHFTLDGRLGVDVARELKVPLGSYGNRIAQGYSVEESLGLEGRWAK